MNGTIKTVRERLAEAREFSAKGLYDAALNIYSSIVEFDPHCTQAYLEAGILLTNLGRMRAALQALRFALAIEPQLKQAQQHLAFLLRHLVLDGYNQELDRDFQICYAADDLDHQTLAHLVAQHLVFKYQLDVAPLNSESSLHQFIQKLSTDNLCLAFLAKSINVNAHLEEQFVRVRRTLLLQLQSTPDIPHTLIKLIAAFGLQCFANEYVYSTDEHEKNILVKLVSSLNKTITPQETFKALLLIAMYQQLTDLQVSIASLELMTDQYQEIADLLSITIADIQEEQRLCSFIKSFSDAHGEVSQKVRIQYEQSPYPRWRSSPAPKASAMARRLMQLPNIDKHTALADNLQLLVAGCGTGFEPIELARMDSTLEITAIDLSLHSLAFARRMANKIAINTIEFLQGDILHIDKLNKKFDVITSTGVLHHMDNPELGLQSLYNVLKPGGFMRIALYSEQARRSIVHARQVIMEEGLDINADSIRYFRQKILQAEQESPLYVLRGSQDLYALSGARDLLFHVQEHRFTLDKIAELLKKVGLNFLTMDAVAPQIFESFSRLFPYRDALSDLYKWCEFEKLYPDTFVGMYHFWLQKPLIK